MLKLILTEFRKLKRTSARRMIWTAPILLILLCIFLGAGSSLQKGCYNWWSTMILPVMLTLISAGVIEKDKKKLHYRGILCLSAEPWKIWIGKTGVCVFLYFISCMVFFAGIEIGGVIFGNVSLKQNIAGSVLLFITFLWQIPLCMFLTDRLSLFPAVFINLAGNMMCAIFASKTDYWWIPYAIPVRLLCPSVGVLPNGLSVPAHDPLMSSGVIAPGILITLVLFLLLSGLTAVPFQRLEAK